MIVLPVKVGRIYFASFRGPLGWGETRDFEAEVFRDGLWQAATFGNPVLCESLIVPSDVTPDLEILDVLLGVPTLIERGSPPPRIRLHNTSHRRIDDVRCILTLTALEVGTDDPGESSPGDTKGPVT